ncbi:threonine synthase [Granulicella tundricola]|uniref:Threonine synthase n=1 Tax=Granulicella tundricola (strain ATCC BAA-1859 / DSM 23138 / MP5ACTX9) TaxID=1198114 RepID=E8WZM9_GRATM|nr:threonine synthase [Granulicella tundricola]ADW70003.1 threonine synthase [Granulicella tundricola MP5ACTX9]
MPKIAYLESVRSHNRISADTPQTLDPATAESLYVRYDMEEMKKTAKRENPAKYAAESAKSLGMWRYKDVLPDVTPVTLGEGWTPMVQSKRHAGLFIKEEGNNPTGSFKARGLAMAVTMAKHYGLQHLAVPSAGNAAGALAAYAAAAGIAAHLYMPQDVPFANYLEGVIYGADVHMIDGLISDCARLVGEEIKRQKEAGTPANEVWFDISTLKEPFRIEGKKTMGYELVEQLGWKYPDAVFYPTGGGVGLIGMWKAFDEMEELGWVERGSKRPKMYALQASGCSPIVKAYDGGKDVSEFFQHAATFAAGLRVPKPYGDAIILDIVRVSGGSAIASTDEEILASILDYAKHEGLFLSPEGAAATAAYERLLASGELTPEETVVLFNTGAGLKYTDMTAEAMKLRRPGTLPTAMPVGGIITPV